MLIKPIEVGDILDEILAKELLDDRGAKAIDIHRVTGGVMDDAFDLAGGAIFLETIVEALDFC